MPVASAVAQQEISQQQSLTLMRNMMRLYLSNVCHGRGLFPESDFERRDVCQLEGVPSLGHREGPVTAEAMRLLSWMEKGVFDALKLRYLDQCVLVVSDDEAAERVREAWVLKMEWTTDADGNSVPRMAFGREGHERYLQQGGERVTKEAVRDVSQHLMRSLHTLLSGLPPLPKATWLSMKLLYREDVTPDDYEPEGFVPAADDKSGLLSFCSQPVELAVGPPVDTGHQVLSTLLYSADPQLVDDGQTTVGEQHAGGLWTVELDGERDELEAPTGGVPETPASEASSRLASGSASATRRRAARTRPPTPPPSPSSRRRARSAAPPRRRRRRATRRPCARRSRRSAAASRRSARRRRASRSTRSSRRRSRSRSARRAPPAAAERPQERRQPWTSLAVCTSKVSLNARPRPRTIHSPPQS